MAKMLAPKYSVGQIVDLSCKQGTRLPDRLKIICVFCNSNDYMWTYQAISEHHGNKVVMTQREIENLECHKQTKVYKTPFIQGLYREGFRWYGNYSRLQADCKGRSLRDNCSIENIRLYQAMNNKGEYLPDQCGVWIKYYTTIDDFGNINISNSDEAVTIIK